MSSTQSDSVLLAVLVAGVLLALGVAWLVERFRPPAPVLPEPDLAPAGLGRLVPVGAQVDAEVRLGLVALEAWLVAQRRTP